jgi:ATP-dependent DNA helicase RecQ
VLTGDDDVALREEREPVSDTRTARKGSTAESLPAGSRRRKLFDALRETRTELAREQNVPPYVIFNDKTLLAMIDHLPETPDEFRRLHGVGDVKLRRYGDAFLSVIRQYC